MQLAKPEADSPRNVLPRSNPVLLLPRMRMSLCRKGANFAENTKNLERIVDYSPGKQKKTWRQSCCGHGEPVGHRPYIVWS